MLSFCLLPLLLLVTLPVPMIPRLLLRRAEGLPPSLLPHALDILPNVLEWLIVCRPVSALPPVSGMQRLSSKVPPLPKMFSQQLLVQHITPFASSPSIGVCVHVAPGLVMPRVTACPASLPELLPTCIPTQHM